MTEGWSRDLLEREVYSRGRDGQAPQNKTPLKLRVTQDTGRSKDVDEGLYSDSFIPSFIQPTPCVPSSLLGTRHRELSKTDVLTAPKELTFYAGKPAR